MLFRKDIEPRCAYCQRGTLVNEREVACLRHGIVPMESSCRSFRYDPLKRTPPRPVKPAGGPPSQGDFTL